ncbi:MAG: RNA methyltransferase [Proteobacteria bacterium]|nr:RNA methyltransferase [Pseudomonadota bacterium]
MPRNLYIALLHYPVYNKNKQVTATAIFNYDIHDISRISKTYGVEKFFIVQPIQKQLELGKKILYHWIFDWGSAYNPRRKEALTGVVLKENFDDVIVDIESDFGKKPFVVVTDAKPFPNSIGYEELKEKIYKSDNPYLIVFGTGWGLTEDFINSADYRLKPVYGEGSYNHLSVRSAVAIILDRLCGR